MLWGGFEQASGRVEKGSALHEKLVISSIAAAGSEL
jgi:hypothetical protein